VPTRWLIGVLLAASLAHVSAAAAGTHSLGSSRSSSIWQTADSRCGALARRPLAPYPWPVAPFHRQHAIRGYFGDPRTVIFSAHDGDF